MLCVKTEETTTKKVRKLPVFDLKRCKRCGICTHFCPEGALAELDEGTPVLEYPEKCTSCGMCEDMCPDWAVCLTVPDQGESASETS
jgi:2-oxoglutarate ferredoxin oxidoreductase subunit delta